MPRVLLGLAAVLVAAELVGLAVRLAAVPAPLGEVLAMDAPWSLPRMLVAGVFAAAAAVAWLGAARHAGRRTWWTAIAGVLTLTATVKAGSTVHVEVVRAVGGDVHPVRGFLVLGVPAALGLCWLFWLSRDERRDRRRVLTWLGLYGLAAIGLSTVSLVVENRLGWAHPLAAVTTWVEESGEATASVGVLFAVLLGVAPRAVLPAGWGRRRPEPDVVVREPATVQ